MKFIAGVAVLGIAVFGQNPQIRRPFKSDPPKQCSQCSAWNASLEPFRLFGNTYYVGTAGLSSVLITSERGHILLDGGLAESAEEIDRHIRRLGFRTEDVRLIVNSHAHFDHAGGIHALAAASGATVAASASGAKALNRGENTSDDPQYGFGRESNEFPQVKKVRVVKDGEVLRVGPLEITARLSKSGDAVSAKGDLEGLAKDVAVGAKDVKITLDSVRQ